jgi:hypothetical protein
VRFHQVSLLLWAKAWRSVSPALILNKLVDVFFTKRPQAFSLCRRQAHEITSGQIDAQVKTRQIRVWLDSGLRKKHSMTPLVGCRSGRLERCLVTSTSDTQSIEYPAFPHRVHLIVSLPILS